MPEKIKPEQCRYVDDVRLTVMLTSESAVICLPDLEGKMDYTTRLGSKDATFRKWCGDMFEYYWAKARPQSEEPRQ